MLILLQSSSQQQELYSQSGKNWPGVCKTGKNQSPVNIIDGINTKLDTSTINFDYSIPKNGDKKKLFYDGSRLYMDINLGRITFFNSFGSREFYSARRIELHFPSEHYLTYKGQTPRHPLELQIHHVLEETNNKGVTNQKVPTKKATVSVLFTLGDQTEGDVFLNALGINKYNKDKKGNYNVFKKNKKFSQISPISATYDAGFSVLALQGLLKILGSNTHMYYYWGSETTPPCREEVVWMVFAQPRSISQSQFDYLLRQLAKNRNPKLKPEVALSPSELFGNKRSIKPYNENKRGKILSNPLGVRKINGHSFYNLK